MIGGTAYGVILNDQVERDALEPAFHAPPYDAPPRAPVLYVKPRPCLSVDGAAVPVPAELAAVTVAATIGLLFGDHGAAAACLALDVSEPHRSYFRPAIRERCRDGFLPLGAFAAVPADLDQPIVTRINGVVAHRWSLARLVRPVARLVADIAAFMTLAPGDLLLVGLAGDAPVAKVGDTVEVAMPGFELLRTRLTAEPA
ncbi:fumarylacetoacetate hydrolase family protein [Sphingomonas bacterium]|uniref:fumarylacetoacetate hydrolase family protein n=1 Tax=Sphingomonas bacterium TaxID=1895847 RepID=UPI00157540C4|nr:fumarylacetoacetate hydrolase family protein [Sphingomonas bacterium]